MTLKSLDFPLLTSNDLVNISDSVPGDGPDGAILSALETQKAIVPEGAFLPQDMFALKTQVTATLAGLSPLEAAKAGDLSTSVLELTTSELSKALFDSGVDPENFSLDEIDFSVEGLTDLNSTLDSFQNAAAGGSSALKDALAGAKLPSELNPESLASGLEKTVTDLLNDAESAARAAETALIDQVDNFSTIDTASLRQQAENITEAIEANYNSVITSLKKGVPTSLSERVDTTKLISEETKKNVESTMKNLKKNVINISDKIVDVSAKNLQNTQKFLTTKIERTQSLVSVENNKKRETVTAALIKKMQDNNPQADPLELDAIVRNMVAKANELSDSKIQTETDTTKNLVNQASAKYSDISRSSDLRAASSASAGRPIAKKSEIISSTPQLMGDNQFFDASYFTGRYAKRVASAVNTLHPKLRERFANAIRDVQNDPEVLAMKGTAFYSYALRSYEEQAILRRKYEAGGPLAAKPGNSWHNYGCACDVVFVINGKAKWDEKFYTGLIRDHFAKYDLENTIRGDSGHFQPVEFRARGIQSAWRIKKDAVVNGIVDPNIVATYIA